MPLMQAQSFFCGYFKTFPASAKKEKKEFPALFLVY